MEKQNKIYATVQGANLLGCSTKPYRYCEEFIRKDALLEWAEEMKEQVGLGLNAYDMGEENGKADMLNALIDKLNSL